MKSLVPFYGQVNKALRSISHWLVSLLVSIFLDGELFIDLFSLMVKHNDSINVHNHINFFFLIYKNENEDSKKYCIKAKF